jgi:hypothetical protein
MSIETTNGIIISVGQDIVFGEATDAKREKGRVPTPGGGMAVVYEGDSAVLIAFQAWQDRWNANPGISKGGGSLILSNYDPTTKATTNTFVVDPGPIQDAQLAEKDWERELQEFDAEWTMVMAIAARIDGVPPLPTPSAPKPSQSAAEAPVSGGSSPQPTHAASTAKPVTVQHPAPAHAAPAPKPAPVKVDPVPGEIAALQRGEAALQTAEVKAASLARDDAAGIRAEEKQIQQLEPKPKK